MGGPASSKAGQVDNTSAEEVCLIEGFARSQNPESKINYNYHTAQLLNATIAPHNKKVK